MKLFPYFVLIRPANLLTAVADVVAGFAIAGVLSHVIFSGQVPDMLLLILSTMGLYAGGIVFNDLFDLEIDRKERPERILPSGQISVSSARTFGTVLLVEGVLLAFLSSPVSGLISLLIVFFALLYDRFGKHHPFFGPINMGLCRGLNLLLGMSIVELSSLSYLTLLSLIPIVFIAAVTLTSRGEVSGNNRMSILLALVLDLVIVVTFIWLGIKDILNLPVVIPFVALWLFMNLYAKVSAIIRNEPKKVMQAVKIGVISLIPLNASYVAGFGHWIFAILVLSLLPLAMVLSRKFAVT
ncbi:MAG: UbiA-like protein EboC [Saprospiraceae bacterium]|nr:UbiA-like protein EboC [Saprospiraceae bacterium]